MSANDAIQRDHEINMLIESMIREKGEKLLA